MGKHSLAQPQLFYYNLNIDERIRPNHPLRKVKALVDFDFVSKKVELLYGTNGNVLVPPPVILKLLFLLFYYDVSGLIRPGKNRRPSLRNPYVANIHHYYLAVQNQKHFLITFSHLS